MRPGPAGPQSPAMTRSGRRSSAATGRGAEGQARPRPAREGGLRRARWPRSARLPRRRNHRVRARKVARLPIGGLLVRTPPRTRISRSPWMPTSASSAKLPAVRRSSSTKRALGSDGIAHDHGEARLDFQPSAAIRDRSASYSRRAGWRRQRGLPAACPRSRGFPRRGRRRRRRRRRPPASSAARLRAGPPVRFRRTPGPGPRRPRPRCGSAEAPAAG